MSRPGPGFRACVCALALAALVPLARAGGPWADEDRDWGVPPPRELRAGEVSAPTPREIPGARTILTAELRDRLARGERMLLFDVLGGTGHDSLPGAIWLPDAGRGRSFDDVVQKRLAEVLAFATQGDRARPLAFLCANSRCWLSYNAALRAAALGYTEVYWYRGGIEAWLAAGLELRPLRVAWRRPAAE